jgi:ethanolamine utilization protein EutQ (cupin superfamily)
MTREVGPKKTQSVAEELIQRIKDDARDEVVDRLIVGLMKAKKSGAITMTIGDIRAVLHTSGLRRFETDKALDNFHRRILERDSS